MKYFIPRWNKVNSEATFLTMALKYQINFFEPKWSKPWSILNIFYFFTSGITRFNVRGKSAPTARSKFASRDNQAQLARRKNRWLDKKSATFEHAQPFSAGYVQVHTSSKTNACDRELRAARIIVYFCPL